MEKESKKRIDIKKIISITSCILIISSLFIISCFATVDTVKINQWYIISGTIVSGSDTARTAVCHGYIYYINNDTQREFYSIQYVDNSNHEFYDIVFQDEENSVILILTNSNKDNIRIMFTDLSEAGTRFTTHIRFMLDEYVPPIDPYTPTADFLEWILNDTTTILGFMISNSVMLLVISIVIVSLAIGVIKRLTNKQF